MKRKTAGALAVAFALMVPGAGPVTLGLGGSQAAAQMPEGVPTVPAGTPVVLLPVQTAQPTMGGAWPGGLRSMTESLRTLEAELDFAFGEADAAEWVMPGEVIERTRRNPLARVDPQRLAYQGLLRKPDPRAQLYEPLHGQLRMLGAMFGARLVVLPLALWYEPGEPLTAAGAEGEAPEAGRAVLLLAVVDTRRSAVLWHGTIEGDPGPATTPRLLTTLALRVAGQMAQ